jgi:hypothetical protein
MNKENATMPEEQIRARIYNPNRPPAEPGSRPEITELEREVRRLYENQTPQTREKLTTVTYQYWAPFNYSNVVMELGREELGAEVDGDGVEIDYPPIGAITIAEVGPIISVTVIGSACTPPGFVMLNAEPIEWKYPRTGIKMKRDKLWGQHVNVRLWNRGVDEAWREAGLSCARFDVPPSRKVSIMGGCAMDVGGLAGKPQGLDAHYCFRTIRVTVVKE